MTQQSISFHNTTGLESSELRDATSKAISQDEIVLQLFKTFDRLTLTPERVHRHLMLTGGKRWELTPLTSIRRSFSNLKNRGLIEKTDTLIKGNFGAKVHLWKLSQ